MQPEVPELDGDRRDRPRDGEQTATLGSQDPRHDHAGGQPDAEQQEACIALEIHIGIDSPPEDKNARMAYQMKRLVEGMGSGQIDDALRLLELINEFIAMRPSSEWLERFSQGIEKAAPESR